MVRFIFDTISRSVDVLLGVGTSPPCPPVLPSRAARPSPPAPPRPRLTLPAPAPPGQPGWRIGVPMVHFVTKRCATDAECERRRRADEPLCTRNVYEDWRCTSCCKGDRCNYYVI
ncbi:hypothetical protein FJT64_018865 [Amphibalanus amphitrite]|uniref:Uncharacterized protein n=1 Tax=Amphibalanus amphitrite TaxID=1232801 RepID=A0A6A4WVN3_AMPAM|nr:hypothetical protein FJT64_018865 [Amphibalanus amphitrite]